MHSDDAGEGSTGRQTATMQRSTQKRAKLSKFQNSIPNQVLRNPSLTHVWKDYKRRIRTKYIRVMQNTEQGTNSKVDFWRLFLDRRGTFHAPLPPQPHGITFWQITKLRELIWKTEVNARIMTYDNQHKPKVPKRDNTSRDRKKKGKLTFYGLNVKKADKFFKIDLW